MSKIKKLLALLLASLALTNCLGQRASTTKTVSAQTIKTFRTDFCSSYKEGPRKNPNQWKHCCIQHDIRYWRGGSKEERLAADRELEKCVGATGARHEPRIMFIGVRLGGGATWRTSYRWGYGWQWKRGYSRLTQAERSQVHAAWQQKRYENRPLPRFLVDAEP